MRYTNPFSSRRPWALRVALCLSVSLRFSVIPALGLFQQGPPKLATAPKVDSQSGQIVKGSLHGSAVQEAVIEGGEAQLYTVQLTVGQYVCVTVEQMGIDLVVTLMDSEGRELAKVDRPSGAMGPESLSHVAQASAEYKIKVHPLSSTAARGKYQIALSELRTAEPKDESIIVAQRVVTHAEELRGTSTAESLKAATEEFLHSIALWRALKDPREESIALYGLGWCYNPQGEYQEALSSFNRSLELARASGDRATEALAVSGVAWAYLYLGEPHEALRGFQHSIDLRRAFDDLAGEATCLNGVGWCHILLHDYDRALESFNRARTIRQSQHDVRGEGIILNSIGVLYRRTARNEEALEFLKRAVDQLRSVGYRYGEANTLSNIGWTYLAMKDYVSAVEYFEQGLSLRRKTGDRAGEANTLYGLASALRRKGDLPAALERMEAALAIVENIRGEGRSYDLTSYFFASVQDYYEFQIDLLMQLDRLHPDAGHAARAFHIAERARARSILDLLSEARVDIRQGADPALLERERDLQRRLDISAGLLVDKSSIRSALAAAKEIDALTAQYHQVQADIRSSSPRYAALTQPRPQTAEQIQRELLDPDTLLLEYALGEQRSFLWLLSKDSLRTFELPARDKIETTTREFYDEVSNRNGEIAGKVNEPSGGRGIGFTRAAATLSRMIIGPCTPFLSDKRLVIVPHGALDYVPFAALAIGAANGDESLSVVRRLAHRHVSSSRPRHTSETPLVADHEVVILPSASTLAILRRDAACRAPSSKALAVFADPVYSAGDQRILELSPAKTQAPKHRPAGSGAAPLVQNATNTTAPVGKQLPRLFLSRKEADQLLSLVPRAESMRAVDFDANRATAMSDALSNYRILHFAVHTFIDDDHPDLSRIALSRFDRNAEPREGSVYAHEIFNLKLAAELVVLSSCRTGLGKEVKGEGLMSLTRSFMYAGARRVIVSLWSVDDRATAELMVRFYRRMLGPDKLSPSAALRAAQFDMYTHPRWRAPYFWAGFILQGEWR